MSEHAYIATYKGVQLGFEMFGYTPEVTVRAPRVEQLFRSPIAAITRPTTGRYHGHRLNCHVRGTDMVDAAELIEAYGDLADDTPGSLLIYKNTTTPVLRRQIDDVWLVTVRPESNREPARAYLVPVAFEFMTNRRAT